MHHNDDLKLNLAKGLLSPVLFKPSPHADQRPPGIDIDLIVIHCISLPKGEFGTDNIERFFCGELDFTLHPTFAVIADLRVSSHLLIKRDGQVVQFVPFHQRAWHAGKSMFKAKSACNDFSIGIELEGTDDTHFTSAQYQQLAKIIPLLMQHYPHIKTDHIVGHEHIAPTRKTDPGSFFDWAYLHSLLRKPL